MPYQLQLKPATLKDGQKYRVIHITDIALHTAKKTPTPSVGKKIQKAFEANESGRIYGPIQKPVASDGTFTLELIRQDPDLMKLILDEEAKGYKVLLSVPKVGIPIVAGKDTVEFVNSTNGKRILRAIAKGKDKE